MYNCKQAYTRAEIKFILISADDIIATSMVGGGDQGGWDEN